MNIGIIGGADGPTAIFVSAGISPYAVVAIAAACIAIAGTVFWKIRKKQREVR